MARTACAAAVVILGLLAVGCSTTPPATDNHAWQRIKLSADEEKSDPLKAAPKLLEEREQPGKLDQAIALLNWHLQRTPESAPLHQLLAEAHSRAAEALDVQKKEDQPYHAYHAQEGIRHADEALRLSPNSGPAHYWRATNLLHAANLERSLGRAKDALKELDAADQISPEVDEGGPSRMRGKVLHDMPSLFGGSVSKAIANFQKSLKLAPNVGTTHLWLGEAYLSARKNDLARKELEWVAAAKPRPGHEKEDGENRQKAQDLLKKLDAK
jgi:tetratricopeptide (TPR) repeat protein